MLKIYKKAKNCVSEERRLYDLLPAVDIMRKFLNSEVADGFEMIIHSCEDDCDYEIIFRSVGLDSGNITGKEEGGKGTARP